ncbi:MAG: transposase [Opitutales bacterium]
MQRRRHSAEFKNEAVKLLSIDGLSVNEVSEKLDVSTGSPYMHGKRSIWMAWKRRHQKVHRARRH